MPKKGKRLEAQPGDIVAVFWGDHMGVRNTPLVPGSLKLIELVTYGEVMHMDDEAIELINEKCLADGSDHNDACAIGMGLVRRVVVYRPVGEAKLD